MIVLIVNYDYFIFELANIRLGGHTCLKSLSVSFLILCFYFHFGTWSIFFLANFLQALNICVHVSLGFVVSFSFVRVCMYLLLFKKPIAGKSKVEQP
jgi:hypothetical protein